MGKSGGGAGNIITHNTCMRVYSHNVKSLHHIDSGDSGEWVGFEAESFIFLSLKRKKCLQSLSVERHSLELQPYEESKPPGLRSSRLGVGS